MKKLIKILPKCEGSIIEVNNEFIKCILFKPNNPLHLTLRLGKHSDIGVLYEFIIESEYEELFEIIKNTYAKPINIVDGGGNIGLFSLFVNRLVNKSSKIIYVEPDILAVTHFEHLISLNSISNCIIQNKALLNESNENIVIENGLRGEGNAGFVVKTTDQSTSVKSINLADMCSLCSTEYINILKIDIEGAEESLILGNNFNEQFAQKIHFIAIEIHDDIVDRIKIETKLHELGFSKIKNNRVDIFENKKFPV